MAASGSAAGPMVALVAAAFVVLTLNAVQAQTLNAVQVGAHTSACINCAKGCFAGCSAKCRDQCLPGLTTKTCRDCRSRIGVCAYFLCYTSKCHAQQRCPLFAPEVCTDCNIDCEAGCLHGDGPKHSCQSQCEKDPFDPLCIACTTSALEACTATCHERSCVVEGLCPSRAAKLCSECDSRCEEGCTRVQVAKDACQSQCQKGPFDHLCGECTTNAIDGCRDTCHERSCVVERRCPSRRAPQDCSKCGSRCEQECRSGQVVQRACQSQCNKDLFAPLCFACITRAVGICKDICYEHSCVGGGFLGCPSRTGLPKLCSGCDSLCEEGCKTGKNHTSSWCVADSIDDCRAACYARDCVVEQQCPSGSGSPQQCRECDFSCQESCRNDPICKPVCNALDGTCRPACTAGSFDVCRAGCYASNCVREHQCDSRPGLPMP